MKLREVLWFSRPPKFPSSRLQLVLGVVVSAGLFVGRFVFTVLVHSSLFFSSIETPFIVGGLSHPWQNPGQAPYGAIWYAINIPIGLAQLPGLSVEQSWLVVTGAIDSVVLFLVFKYFRWWVGAAYSAATFLMFRQAPYNVCIMWLTLGGLVFLPSLALAVLAKLPVGAPLAVWDFISHSSQLQSNWRYYGLLVAVWLGVLYIRVRGEKPILPVRVRAFLVRILG